MSDEGHMMSEDETRNAGQHEPLPPVPADDQADAKKPAEAKK